MNETNIYDYSILSAFNEIFYKNLLQKKHLVDELIHIGTVKIPNKPDLFLNSFFYVLRKGSDKYLLLKEGPQENKKNKECIKDLPLKVTEYELVAFKGTGYKLIKKYNSQKVLAKKVMSFRELINNFAHFKHSQSRDFLLFKILAFSSYFGRINFRCSSQPAFGKDSVFNLLNDLVGNISIVQRPTIAKLEYLSINKVLVCNEMSNLSETDQSEIEHYLLAVGAFANKYTKRSRGNKKLGISEEYNISKLSLTIMYNDLDCYSSDEKYFDMVFPKQIIDRFPAFKFKGKLLEDFDEVINPELIAKQNEPTFLKIIRTIKYFQDFWRDELKPYASIDFGLGVRYQRIFGIIGHFVNLYSKNEKEYKMLMGELFNRFNDYKKMVNPPKLSLNGDSTLINFDGTPIKEEVI